MRRKIIFYELNEVPRKVFEEFVRWQPKSVLARRRMEFRWYDTYAEDESVLSPWITWSTVHRGVTDRTHMIRDFGQDLRDANREYPPIWHILANAGVRTGICGSLHSYPPPSKLDPFDFYLPDTFATGSECFPKYLEDFQEFNLCMARGSARNVSTQTPWTSALRLLTSARHLGLRATTGLDIALQLTNERLTKERRVRRRTYQTVLAFDIFMRQLERTRPAFCTFFTNHVASAMHRYWAATFPEDYETFHCNEQWVRTYRSEISFALSKFDQELARLITFTDKHSEYQLWIATSMGQAATEARTLETQLYITNCEKFMARLGLIRAEWSEKPAMLPRYCFQASEAAARKLVNRLSTLAIDGEPIEDPVLDGSFVRIKLGQANLHEKGECVTLGGQPVRMSELGLENVKIDDRSGTTAYHIPQGCLAIYDPRDRRRRVDTQGEISTLELAPALLENFGISRPSYMVAPGTLAGGAS